MSNQPAIPEQIGRRVRGAVEMLIRSLDRPSVPEGELFEAAVTVMLRLAFLFAAEERGLSNDERISVSTLRDELRAEAEAHGEEVLGRRFGAWVRLLAAFRAAHGGYLFDPDRFPFLQGPPVSDRIVLRLLEVLRTPGGIAVEQLGHLYEGMLDYAACRAAEPMLGLVGTKGREPTVALTEMEEQQAGGEKELLKLLRGATGRNAGALKKALAAAEGPEASRFLAACGNDASLCERATPFAGLLRADAFGRPLVIPAGRVYLTPAKGRRASGTHYTPRSLTEPVVRHALEPLVYDGPAEGKPKDEWRLKPARELLALKVCDIATGSGAFLIEACRYLAERLVEAWGQEEVICEGKGEDRLASARRMVAEKCLYGVDRNPLAVEITRLSFWLLTHARGQPFTFLDHAIRCGDSLVGVHDAEQLRKFPDDPNRPPFHWPLEFPEVFADRGGFDAVIGNPPWGQKAIDDAPLRDYVRRHYPSAKGIFDLFRPFVERAVQLVRPGGALGLVLPDILLLKNYPATRKHLLDRVRIRRLTWHAMPFPGAVIDAVTLVGLVGSPEPGDCIRVVRHERGECMEAIIPQAGLARPPGYEFNLYATRTRKASWDALADYPTLGEFFEVHEGVHSGNIRGELFVGRRLDDSCRELYFGREEIRPHRLTWAGRFVRLSAIPDGRTNGRYANPGRPEWYSRPKVLVRRTGDRVLAAADESGRYASNNFFVVLPRVPGALEVYGLAALLNSRFLTWFYRSIVPRRGRAFAELKIRHLRTFPLPQEVTQPGGCAALNELGRRRAQAEGEEAARLDDEIERVVEGCFGIGRWGEDGEPERAREDRSEEKII